MKKILLSLVAIMLATVARAADGDTFTFEGLKYKVLSEADHTAEVAVNDVSGEVNIPTYVTANGSRYTVTSIGKSAFNECSDLTSVTIPNSVDCIDNEAFYGCSSLTKIIDLRPFPQGLGADVFKNVPSDAVVYIPKGSYMYYGQSGFLEYFSDFREMGAFDITLSESTLRLSEGESAKLTVTVVKDDDVTIGDHEWTSSNPEVATVEDGKVIAIAPGTAEITYTVYDGYGVAHSDSCKVVVGAAGINDVTVDDTSSSVYVYTLSGMTVLSNAPVDEVHNLPAGLYIVRQGNTVKKIAVKSVSTKSRRLIKRYGE